jgi:hypothetical protein
VTRRVFVALTVTIQLLLAACTESGDPNPDGKTVPPAQLMVWTVNIKHLEPPYDWRDVFDSMASPERAPDIVLVQEVSSSEAAEFVAGLNTRLGTPHRSYEYRATPTGFNMVVWNEARLDISDAHTARQIPRNELFWRSWTGPRCNEGEQEIVAVRLWDGLALKSVVAASVRWLPGYAALCMQRNLHELDARLEEMWPRRSITIVGGDFNSHPDRRTKPGDPPKDALASGSQSDPECWYRSFSALESNTLSEPRTGNANLDCTDDPDYRSGADAYYDSVWLSARAQGEICDQWTYTRGAARMGTACTDTNGDGLRDRSRIDYIWVRWEGPDGSVRLPPEAAAQRLIVGAGADQTCTDCRSPTYSDHRAVRAEIES